MTKNKWQLSDIGLGQKVKGVNDNFFRGVTFFGTCNTLHWPHIIFYDIKSHSCMIQVAFVSSSIILTCSVSPLRVSHWAWMECGLEATIFLPPHVPLISSPFSFLHLRLPVNPGLKVSKMSTSLDAQCFSAPLHLHACALYLCWASILKSLFASPCWNENYRGCQLSIIPKDIASLQ